MGIKYYTVSLMIIGLLGIFPGCTKNKSVSENNEHKNESNIVHLSNENKELIKIETTKAEMKKLKTKIFVPGVVTYNEKRLTHITSRISGIIEEVFVFLQTRVKAGEHLLSIYSPEYLTFQSEFIQAEERLKRTKQIKDIEEETTAKSIYESAKRKLEILGVTEEEISKLEKSHAPQTSLIVRASFTGTIVESNVVQGNYVQPGSNLYKLADLTTLWIIADVYEKDIAYVESDKIAEIQTTAYPDKIFKGNITAIGDILEEKTRTFKVRIEITNPEGKLKPGMFVNILIESESYIEIFAVPISAIQTEGGKEIVFIEKKPNTYIKREVKTGLRSEEFVQILDGINTGEKVVSKGSFILKSELLKKELEEE